MSLAEPTRIGRNQLPTRDGHAGPVPITRHPETMAETVTPSMFRLLTTPNYDVAGARSEFPPATLVECERHAFQD